MGSRRSAGQQFPPEAAIKPIGPGQTVCLIARVTWRFARRRPVLAAWWWLVAISCVLPCLFYYNHLSGTSKVLWLVGGGAVGRIDTGPNPALTWDSTRYGWYPSVDSIVAFDLQWTLQGQAPLRPPRVIIFPVWITTLAPTLLIGTPIFIRNHKRRRREQRAVRAGRTPCPSCEYDVTGLTRCPECGATINPATEPSP